MNDHQRCQELLPWYANGTLNETETVLCSRHIDDCDTCRDDLAMTIDHMQQLSTEPLPTSVHAPNQTDLLIETVRGRRPPSRTWQRWHAATAATVVVATAMLLTLSIPQPPSYRLLTDPIEDDAFYVQVAFEPNTSEEDIRRFVLSSGGTVAGNPTPAGIYRIRFEERPPAATLEKIKTASKIAWANEEL